MDTYLNPPTYSREKEDQFYDYAQEDALKVCMGGWASIVILFTLFWPTDFWAYSNHPEFIVLLAKIRTLGIVVAVFYLLMLSRVQFFRQAPFKTTIPGLCVGLFIISLYAAEMGGLDTPSFYWSYIIPALTTICFTLTFKERFLATFALSTSCLLGYFGRYPEYLNY